MKLYIMLKSVLTDKEKAEQKLSKIEPSFLKTTEDGIKSGLKQLKHNLLKLEKQVILMLKYMLNL
jgi:hypothetical protein